MIERLDSVIATLFKLERPSDVTFHIDLPRHKIFSFPDVPEYIFKFGAKMEARFNKILKCRALCEEHQLDCLVIPKCQKFKTYTFKGVNYDLLMEERLSVTSSGSVQERNYAKAGIERLILQLITFIVCSEWRDVVLRNIPHVNGEGEAHVALFDLEETFMREGARWGLFGGVDPICEGLIHCLPETYARYVQEVIERQYPEMKGEAESAIAERKRRLELESELESFYKKQGIEHGGEEISFEFADSEMEREIIDSFNSKIRVNRELEEEFIKYKRRMTLAAHPMLIKPTMQAIAKLIEKGALHHVRAKYDELKCIKMMSKFQVEIQA